MIKQIKNIGLILFLLIVQNTYSQTNQEIALEKGRKAIEIMDNGQIDEAIKMLEEAQKLDPQKFDYPYEIAYGYYAKKDYKKAIKILEKIENHKDVSDRLFQLLGNAYDNIGKSDEAVKVYEKGLNKFPNSGNIYLELGIVSLSSKNYDKALSYFEKGIYVAPTFPSNYYWASKIYCSSTEEMWGMLYGEIFMNLERNSKRTAEISKILYDTYKSQIKFISDSSISVSFSKQATINVSDITNTKDIKLPYGVIYEPTLMLSIIGEKSIDINSLNRIRSNFVMNYFKKEFNKKYPNLLFDYQKQLLDLGYFEAYNHWILMKGDEDSFEKWYTANKDKWDNFVKWFQDNGIPISETNRFYTGQY